MATAEFNPIDAFIGKVTGGKKLIFKEAYLWDLKKIKDFLKDASENPNKYGVPDWQNRKKTLEVTYKYIDSLTVTGVCYSNPTPAQQIFRTKLPIKKPKYEELEPTPAIPWATNDRRKPFWAIFDLLGLFLSLLGPATHGATAKNYFLPLAVVFARWCSALSDGPAHTPTMVQVTWVTKDKELYPFLGASIGGFATSGTWAELVKRKRHCIMGDILQDPYTAYGSAPMLDGNERAAWNLGNCAETYPFLYLLTDATVKGSSFGIAVQVGKTNLHAAYDGKACWEGPLKVIMPPCMNCKRTLEVPPLELKDRVDAHCFELWNKP